MEGIEKKSRKRRRKHRSYENDSNANQSQEYVDIEEAGGNFPVEKIVVKTQDNEDIDDGEVVANSIERECGDVEIGTKKTKRRPRKRRKLIGNNDQIETNSNEFNQTSSQLAVNFELSSADYETQRWIDLINKLTAKFMNRSQESLGGTRVPKSIVIECLSLIKHRMLWILHESTLQKESHVHDKDTVTQQLAEMFISIIPSINLFHFKTSLFRKQQGENEFLLSEVNYYWKKLLQHRLSTKLIQRLLSNAIGDPIIPNTKLKKQPKAKLAESNPTYNSSAVQHPSLPLGLVSGPEFRHGKRIYTFGNYNNYYKIRREAFAKFHINNHQEQSTACSLSTDPVFPTHTEVPTHEYAEERSLEKSQQLSLQVAATTLLQIDPRLQILASKFNNDLFVGKVVLDIGCNAGVIPLTIAGLFNALRVTGVDIDTQLISASLEALRSIKHHFFFKHQQKSQPAPSTTQSSQVLDSSIGTSSSSVQSSSIGTSSSSAQSPTTYQPLSCYSYFLPPIPKSFDDMPPSLKSLLDPSSPRPTNSPFPFNIEFRAEDFSRFPKPGTQNKSQSSSFPLVISPVTKRYEISTYDTILAFSVTKWIHMNSGDHGIQRTFRKVYEYLKPGTNYDASVDRK